MSFPVCIGAVPEDVRVRFLLPLAPTRTLVPGSFEVGKGVGQPAAEMTLIVAAHAYWSCPAWQA